MVRKSLAALPMLFMVLFWNGIVGVFDGIIAVQYYRQHDARQRFEPVNARITRSRVDSRRSTDRTTHRAEIEFRYEFGGVEYTSDRHAFLSLGTSDRDFAEASVKRFPAGAEVTAYVDPENASEAVLDLSGDSFPAALLLFLAPFNCIGLGLIGLLIASVRQPTLTEEQKRRARHVVIDTGDHVVFGKERASALTVTLLSMTGTTFLSVFVLAFTAGIGASLGLVLTLLAGCAGLSVAIAVWRSRKNRAPENFLHVDRTRRTFSYPANAPGEPLDSIRSILVEPKSTGVTINDVPQFQHTFEAETPGGVVKLFELRGGQDEGNEVLELLRAELL